MGFSALVWKGPDGDWDDVELVPLSYAQSLAPTPAEPAAPGLPETGPDNAGAENIPPVNTGPEDTGDGLRDGPEIQGAGAFDPIEAPRGQGVPAGSLAGLPARVPARVPDRGRWGLLGPLGIILAAVLIGLLVFGPPGQDTGEAHLEALRKLFDSNGFSTLAIAQAGASLEASGDVESDAELARLVELVKGQPLKVFLRISVRRDILEAAREALASYGFYPNLSFGQDGRPIVAAYMLNKDVEDRAFQDLAFDVPSLDPVRAVIHRDALEPILRNVMADEDLSGLEVAWRDGLLEIAVPAGFEGDRALSRAAQKAAAQTGVPVVYAVVKAGVESEPLVQASPAVVEAAPAPAEADPDNPIASLEVVGVTLSPMRFISTRDGQKLFQGSPLPSGWVITGIEADTLILSRDDESMTIDLLPSSN
jgi:type III secretion protein D